MTTMNLLIIDDHSLFRKSLINTIKNNLPFQNIYEASNRLQALEICKSKLVHIVLLNINMPILEGFETAKSLLQRSIVSRPYVIVLTLYKEASIIYQLLELGVHGFVNKDCDLKDLLATIESVVKGNLCYPQEYNDKLKKMIHQGTQPSLMLSAQERSLIQLIGQGKTNKEIAQLENCSVRTIESKRLKLERKLLVRNAAELIDYSYRNGILSL
jgi:DNA-binding NarL/FixJ family response regulator